MNAHSSGPGTLAVPPAGPPEQPYGEPAVPQAVRGQPVALVDLLDRVLAGGVVIVGEVRLSIADIDMVSISLKALISSVSTVMEHAAPLPELQDRS